MIGKFIPIDEVQPALNEKKKRDEFEEQLKAELKAIKKGQCLRYECKEGGSSIQEAVFLLLTAEVKGLKQVTSGNYTYVYRE